MVLIVGALSAFAALCVDMYLPALPMISRELHTSASAVQLSLTACLIGIATGQLIVGPISDRLGRRPPLFVGIGAFIVASAACAFAPNILVLIVLRFIQGFGGGAGIVLARAIVRDLYSGPMAARFFSLLMLVTGAGPILAPQIGAGLLHLGSWRLSFLALALAGIALLAMAIFRLSETLPSEYRTDRSLGKTMRTLHLVATDRGFLVNALACGLGYGALFAYIAGSSFALENVYGLTPQTFSLVFAANAVGMICAAQMNARLIGRVDSRRLLTIGLAGLALGGIALLAVVVVGGIGLAGILPCMFLVLTSNGFIGPNAMALALNDFPESAGSAAALVGVLQYAIGAVAAPLVGLGGTYDVLPMAILIAGFGLAAITLRLVFRPGGIPGPIPNRLSATPTATTLCPPDTTPP